MTMDPALERLRDAIQEYAREREDPNLLITDFAVAYAAIDMHTAESQTFLGSAAHGPVHSTIGLAHTLVHDLTAGLTEGDDA